MISIVSHGIYFTNHVDNLNGHVLELSRLGVGHASSVLLVSDAEGQGVGFHFYQSYKRKWGQWPMPA